MPSWLEKVYLFSLLLINIIGVVCGILTFTARSRNEPLEAIYAYLAMVGLLINGFIVLIGLYFIIAFRLLNFSYS